jgi:hypothetical protein
MFQSCKIEIIRLEGEGEGEEAMRERVMKVLNDVDFQLLLRMKNAERVHLRLVMT